MSTKSNDLYCDTEALENVKEKISLLHNGYVVLGPTSNGGGLKEDGNRIRNILNSLDAYDNSYDNFFDKYDLSSKANIIYNKSNKFVESWIDFSTAFSKSYKLLGDSTTTATDIMENFDSSGSNTAPRINSPYDYVSYLKKQGKDKEAASIEFLLKGGVTGASLVSKNGTKSKNNNTTNKSTGTGTGSASAVYTSPSSSSSSSSSTSDKTGPQHNGVIKIDEEEKEKFEEFKEKFKDQEEKLRKEQEEVEKQQKEIKNQQEALKKQQEEIKKQQDEIAKKQEELAKKDEELKKREEELNNREQQNNNTPANGPTTPNDSNNGNNNTPSDNNNYNNNNNNSAPQNTVYRQENTTPVANNSTAPAETGTVDTPTTTPTTPEKVENTTPSTKGDSGSLGTGNDLFGDDPEPTTTPTTLPDADTTTKSSKSGFNPIPIAVGLGAAVAGGVGVKAYKNHKQNSEFDDTNEDSFTNGNRFWTEDEPNVVNSEQNEINSDELFNEQTTAPSYSAVTNQANNSDTWSVQDTSTSEDDSRTYDLLGEN